MSFSSHRLCDDFLRKRTKLLPRQPASSPSPHTLLRPENRGLFPSPLLPMPTTPIRRENQPQPQPQAPRGRAPAPGSNATMIDAPGRLDVSSCHQSSRTRNDVLRSILPLAGQAMPAGAATPQLCLQDRLAKQYHTQRPELPCNTGAAQTVLEQRSSALHTSRPARDYCR